jgi:hypothetical protein
MKCLILLNFAKRRDGSRITECVAQKDSKPKYASIVTLEEKLKVIRTTVTTLIPSEFLQENSPSDQKVADHLFETHFTAWDPSLDVVSPSPDSVDPPTEKKLASGIENHHSGLQSFQDS